MDANQEMALIQLRKSVEKLGSSTEGYGEKTLMRFLIARSMDSEKAAKMFCQWKKWRAEMVPRGYIPDSEVSDELASEKVYLQGLTKKGHAVMLVKVNKHFPSKDQVQFKKFVIHLLDKTIASSFKGREIGNEKLVGILDLQSITYSNVDTRGLITGFQFLQIRIVISEEQKQEFIREVGEDVLPEEYGGRAKLVLLQDVAVNY
ncbi:uncharacterized protein LOC132032873 isoform X2 [Lycium ferocissimum]|uniref:uncharacterized protein LOC132032873 isoform X2 n=1 Tax=Lycium ferocissimum TaxID=112874 RepID=UPI002814DF24|nr:uncharacterized protein LOC132032873 isoform X2 [Lycium ferocissimum]